MSGQYEIPMVLRIRATDAAKAVRVAEYLMAATRRYSGADLAFAQAEPVESRLGEMAPSPVRADFPA